MGDKKEQVDAMRDRLEVSSLDKQDRKELFEKFQKSGGKVIDFDDKPKPSMGAIDRPTKSKSAKVVLDTENNPFRQDDEILPIVDNSPSEQKTQTSKISVFKFFWVRTACFLANLFNFSGTRFSKKFKSMCQKTAHLENSTLKSFISVLFQDEESEKFKIYLAENKLLLELEYVYHAYNLIDGSRLQKLSELMELSVDDAEKTFCDIFKNLTFFYTYQKRMQTSIFVIAEKYAEYFHKKIHVYYEPKKVSQIFTFIWSEWYIWLEELVNYYWTKYNYRTPYLSLESFLHRGENPIIVGQLAKKWEEIYSQKQKTAQEQLESEELEESIYPNENIEKGVLFIKNYVDFEQYYEGFQETKDLRSLMPPTDKIFYAYVLVDFFDREFSLAWNDINFYVVSDGGSGRFDPKREIKLLHNQLMQFGEMVNDFLRIIKSTTSSSTPTTVSKEREISRSSFNARKMLLPVVESYRALLANLILNRDKDNDSIGNWEETLLTQKNQTDKALHGYSAEHIVGFAYAYMDALAWLMKYSDLSGLDSTVYNFMVLPEITEKKKNN